MNTHPNQILAQRYNLQSLIERHGQVELYDALDVQLQRPVVVQMVSEEGARDQDLCRDFRRHQQVASTIHHCQVGAVYDAGDLRGRPFSVMERFAGTPAEQLAPTERLASGGDPAPELGSALLWTREASEALHCVREAGLTDWTFSYRAVRVDDEGSVRLALIEGLGTESEKDKGYSSSTNKSDPNALGGLLRMLLVGSPDPGAAGLAMPQLPASVVSLLDRTFEGKSSSFKSAGDMAAALQELETRFSQATQAYIPVAEEKQAGAPAVVTPAQPGPHDAPTLVAQALPLAPAVPWTPMEPVSDSNVPAPSPMQPETQPVPQAVQPHSPKAVQVPGSARSARMALPLLLALGGLLLFFGLAAVLARPSQGTLAGQATTPDATSAPLMIAPSLSTVPDMRGKVIEDARALAAALNLNLAADYVYSADVPPDAVVSQQPEPGSQLQVGNTITVSLSMGPEAVQINPAPPPPAAEEEEKEERGGGKKGRGKEKDD